MNHLVPAEKTSDFHVFQDERFIDLNLYQFGWEQTPPAHSYGPHARNHYLFHYIIAGEGTLYANKEALTFIESNFNRDISVKEIAQVCGLNRSYFSRVFRATVGQTPQVYLLQYRMARAAQLLKTTRLTVAEIASQVSYDNPLHFSRAFKNVHGTSLRSYRASHLLPPQQSGNF